jgi:23S rRNA (uracil1939-C5)-methyltransferase
MFESAAAGETCQDFARPRFRFARDRLPGYTSPPMEETVELDIRKLGASGDGIADGPLFVPGALPGERVRAQRFGKDRARAVEILVRAPERVEPPCPHFRSCGGCAVQHLAEAPYVAWKTGLLTAALAARGLDAKPSPMLRIAPATRRRAEFEALRTPTGV